MNNGTVEVLSFLREIGINKGQITEENVKAVLLGFCKTEIEFKRNYPTNNKFIQIAVVPRKEDVRSGIRCGFLHKEHINDAS